MTDECGLAEATATRPLTHDDLKKQSESTAGSHSKKPYMLRFSPTRKISNLLLKTDDVDRYACGIDRLRIMS